MFYFSFILFYILSMNLFTKYHEVIFVRVCFHNTIKRLLLYDYCLLLWDFFTPALADGFSQELEGTEVSLSVQASSQYAGRS